MAHGKEFLSVDEIRDAIQKMKGLSLFQGIQDMINFMIEHGQLVLPKQLVFKTEPLLRDGIVLDTPTEFAYIIPFLENVASIISWKDKSVLYCIDNPKPAPPGTYRSILDGSFYKNHPLVKKYKDEHPLAFIVYGDGLELTDTASARVGQHNVTNIYWTLANIYPELRSSDRSINLLATIKTKWLTPERFDRMMENFIEGLIKFASEEGVQIPVGDVDRTFHGLLVCSCGDNPAQAAMGGFKETVRAEKPCRRCLASKFNYLQITETQQFELRTLETHLQHLAAVEAYTPPPSNQRLRRLPGQEHPNPSVRYGVNRRSPLMPAPHFDVVVCLVQDWMHIGSEGLLELVNRKVLVHVIKVKKKMSLDDVNKRIKDYSKFLTHDRPSSANTDEHLDKKLRQSAAQMQNLSILLPFVLRQKNDATGSSDFAGDQDFIDLLILILKIMNLCMSYELFDTGAERLDRLITEFHKKLLEIDPDIAMGKLHFIHHICEQIALFGPPRQQACFRFEGHHAFFKRLLKITKNFINVLLSIALRHQTRQCHYLMKESFLYIGHQFGKKTEIPSNVCDPVINMVKAIIPWQETDSIVEVTWIKMYGTTYKAGSSIILISDTGILPQFAKILKIIVINEKRIGFVGQRMETLLEDKSLNAYKVCLRASKIALNGENLIFPHEILSIKSENEWHVIPLGHRALLT